MSTEITTAAVETLALHLQEYWARSAPVERETVTRVAGAVLDAILAGER